MSIFRGTNLQLVADNALAKNGLGERDLRVINLDAAKPLAALASKGIDASVGDYQLYKLRDAGPRRSSTNRRTTARSSRARLTCSCSTSSSARIRTSSSASLPPS